jgi:pimeloyl-ACP methyl ester carboxylesterase
MTLHHIDVPGVTLHADDIGDGEPLVFLSGLLCDSSLFEHQAHELARHARVIRIDWRGHGYSPRPIGSGWKMERLVEDVRAVCNALQVERVSLVGFGLGGNVAARFALEHPQRMRSLALMNCCLRSEDLGRRIRLHVLAGMCGLFGPNASLSSQTAGVMFSSRFREAHGAVVESWRHALERMHPDVVRGMLRMFAERDSMLPRVRRLAEFRLPILLLASSLDRVVPPQAMLALSQDLRTASLHVVADAGHALPLEQPEAVLSALRSFLADAGVIPPEHLQARAA